MEDHFSEASIQERRISLRGVDSLQLLGQGDQHLKEILKNFDARITVRGSEIILQGREQELRNLDRLFTELILMLNRNEELRAADVETLITVIKRGDSNKSLGQEGAPNFLPKETREDRSQQNSRPVIIYTKNAAIKPKTDGQLEFYNATLKNDIVFVIGPAGTGKTYLAVAIAVAHLRDRQMDRIILARPAVEAGESLGFLPGDLREKVDPYLRPLYDALYDMIPAEKLRRYLETQMIEIVPLAYMRGRTLNNAFVILDEAQNTTPMQMKMFLTRLGVNAKAIVTGDITQIDLPTTAQSGLVQIRGILQGIEGISFVYLSDRDVVRHKLVRDIIKAYDNYSQ
ncbi:MAG: PhoH family protein [candidate division KSB1 bacterium]|nr:PhoH family protein [candidate division KSB1 bacterium]MDZ7302916.1 PhoH family protein [candidate division KSB1 bacterium]MDZ7310491.1 PhoH family protein [candidate division KSB1 bacterium]